MQVGFVGLGGIGTEMVKRLLGGGHEVNVFERGAGLAAARDAGASTDADYRSLAASSDLLVVCVYRDAQLAEVAFERGALAAMRPGSVFAIHTTGSPELARRIGAEAPAGVSVLDATFSGGPDDVVAGRLSMMVGGDADALARVRPAFETYASRIVPVGPLGHGQTVKLLNNLLFATNLMNAVELLRLATSMGYDTATVAEVLQVCSGASYAMNLFKSAPPESMLEGARPYMEKDVATALAVAAEVGLDISPFASTAAYFGPKG